MSSPLTLFIYESLTAVAYHEDAQNSSLLAEGRAMAEAIVSDFAALDECRVVTIWGSRLRRLNVPNLKTYVADSDEELRTFFRQCCEQADRVMIVAPECEDVLRTTLQQSREYGPDAIMNVSGEALNVGCDKWELAQFCEREEIPHLPTELWTGQTWDRFPAILKPRDGAGCEKLCLLQEGPSSAGNNTNERMIIQPFISGVSLSSAACFSSTGERRLTLPLGEQHLRFTDSVEYVGGRIPWDNPNREIAESQAERIWGILERELTGLRGYVGIDWLLETETQTLTLVELNPRLTTSYLGYRKLFGQQITQAILELPLLPHSSHIRSVQFAANPDTRLPLPGDELV